MSSCLLVFLLFVFYIQNCLALRSETPELRCQHGDQKVFLVEHLLNSEELEWFGSYLQNHRPWILNHRDPYQQRCFKTKSDVVWISPLSLESFQGTRLWRVLSGLIKNLAGIGKDHYLCDATFTISNRMDFNPVSNDTGGNDYLMVQIFLNDDIKKNDYGETVFYDSNREVFCAVYPAAGRALIWNSSISYAAKPPSMLYVQGRNSILLKLTDSKKKHQHCLQIYKENKQSLWQTEPQTFPFTSAQSNGIQRLELGTINFAEHLTNKYFDSHGREIAVFDDILTKSELDILCAYLVKDYNSFGFQPYDSDRTEDHDNVAWISVQKVDVLVKSKLWNVVKQTAQYLSGLDEWYPYDVSMNIIQSFHHTRIHEDCETHEHEYTFLLYLNPDWNENDYGETVFFDLTSSTKKVKRGDEEYETVAAVRPRYGRIIMFRGIIPHSARPPSPAFKGARYTFACKVSRTYRASQSKQLQETFQALHELGVDTTNEEDLLEQLQDQHKMAPQVQEDFLGNELKRQKKRLTDLMKNNQEHLLKKLSD